MGRGWTRWIGAALAVAALVTMLAALYAIFFVAPLEMTMGIAQKIFYIHVGSAMNMLLAFGVCALAGATFLAVRAPRARAMADAIGVATAEVGVTLGAIVLVTGPLWARKAWGTWWTWEPRLTLSLMVFLLFLAYLALRAFAGSDRFGRGVAAGLSIMGIPAIYFIHFAVERWGGAHPQVVYKGGLTVPGMKLAFWLSVLAVSLVTAALAYQRAVIETQRQAIDALFLELDRREGLP
ncbi:MAG: cytochrome c biogenesis protein CcsA [Deltaproteobacteria bacterium]|nr:cytochrome c biogenesis protein CcsA [Deltaproteobacteria bacterium]